VTDLQWNCELRSLDAGQKLKTRVSKGEAANEYA
jgi:hypothetical protein